MGFFSDFGAQLMSDQIDRTACPVAPTLNVANAASTGRTPGWLKS